VRSHAFGRLALGGASFPVTSPAIMLAFLLFTAGTAVGPGQLLALLRAPRPLLVALAANLSIPVVYVLAMTGVMRIWHPPEIDEVQDLLAGLALVASVPVAGSSTAWSQNSDGDMPFSVAFLAVSTALSPVTGPVALRCLRPLAVGGYADALGGLGAAGGGLFLLGCVVVPLAAGMALRRVLGEARMARSRPAWKGGNAATLVLLNYANASALLPRLLEDPDWHFFWAAAFFAGGLCLVSFAGGWALGRLFRFGRGRTVSLMFGLGMTNNGTGLVLASVALGRYPRVVLPIILYNLMQHLAAGAAQNFLTRRPWGRCEPFRRGKRDPSPVGVRGEGTAGRS
jgi:BASS family bile acid:Na+ symporter